MQFSQTQLANFNTFGALAVIILEKVGVIATHDQVVFIIAASWALGWTVYNYIQRWQRGDLNIAGVRK